MAKFNVVQKRKRAEVAERKRAIHGDPRTGKLKNKSQPLSISGKRKRKLVNKWRREQKEVLEKGLVTMEDVVQMGEGTSTDASKTPTKFNVKKGLKIKQLKRKGKSRRKSKPAAKVSADAMVE